jgi:hypothetical protein
MARLGQLASYTVTVGTEPGIVAVPSKNFHFSKFVKVKSRHTFTGPFNTQFAACKMIFFLLKVAIRTLWLGIMSQHPATINSARI